ncbi:MAG: KH domain-containing protein [Fusobacteria bacterium]|nr:KH domain-containing protein [Fusobacteriota bacterium]
MENLKGLLEHIILGLIDKECIKSINMEIDGKKVVYKVEAVSGSTGRLIGKNGTTATAIRQVMQAVGAKENIIVDVYFA